MLIWAEAMRRVVLSALVMAAISAPTGALASEELHGGSGFAGFPPNAAIFGDKDLEAAARGAFALDVEPAEKSGGLSQALLTPQEAPTIAANGRFKWAFLVIAFAGLTAAFMRKGADGRGLIAG